MLIPVASIPGLSPQLLCCLLLPDFCTASDIKTMYIPYQLIIDKENSVHSIPNAKSCPLYTVPWVVEYRAPAQKSVWSLLMQHVHTPLTISSMMGHLDIVSILLCSDADVNKPGGDPRVCLHALILRLWLGLVALWHHVMYIYTHHLYIIYILHFIVFSLDVGLSNLMYVWCGKCMWTVMMQVVN